MKYIFGPVNSRRFGVSLGIDLSPDRKSCNFDCLYCELDKNIPVEKIYKEPEVDTVIQEVYEYLQKNPHPDVITVTSNGEPTLYTNLDELIDKLNKIKGKSKTLILSNGSTVWKRKVQQVLKKFDVVKLSLDAPDEKIFKKIDRPLDGIRLSEIIEGIKSFRKIYDGELIIEVMIVRHINDNKEIIQKLADILKDIKPDRVDLGTVDRPPAYRVNPVSNELLFELSEYFEGLNVNVITRNEIRIEEKRKMSKDEIINTLRKRPFTYSDIEMLMDRETAQLTYSMIKEGILKTKRIGSVTFIYAD
ncbi:radical SAM protein [Persephonella sp.]